MRRKLDLARQITIGLVIYGALLSGALFLHGLLVNERAERMFWQAMLQTSMDDLLERRTKDPSATWRNNGKLDLYELDTSTNVPAALKPLRPGLHDNVFFGNNEWAVYVGESNGKRMALALDIDGFEQAEWELVKPVILSSVLLMILLSVAIYFGARLLVRPLRDMASRIGALSPVRRGQRIDVPPRSSSELEVIAGALNDYLERNDRFVDRERAFIDTASHELRTPISVIRSAAELALSVDNLVPPAAKQLQRIARTTREVDELVSMLLVLAKDPQRMRNVAERIRLDELVPDIVDNHRPLANGKALELVIGELTACEIIAPEAVVRVAIGNLLRNAIEHSDSGQIHVSLEPGARIAIRDPGHGMTPEEISALYARLARGGDSTAGIGLALITRLCEHLGWTLEFAPAPERGTTASLDLGSALAS